LKILIVCASNICRSPYAEYVLKRKVAEDKVLSEKIEWIKSAAVLNKMRNIHPKAKVALENKCFSIDEIKKHKPAYLYFNYKRFKQADIIIGMTNMQKYFLPFWFWKKFTTLSEVSGDSYTKIPDPFLEKTQQGYDKVMGVIDNYIDKYLETLKANFN